MQEFMDRSMDSRSLISAVESHVLPRLGSRSLGRSSTRHAVGSACPNTPSVATGGTRSLLNNNRAGRTRVSSRHASDGWLLVGGAPTALLHWQMKPDGIRRSTGTQVRLAAEGGEA